MKDAYYFSHDANAHNDPKMLNLRLSSGWEGIGLYWTFLEILRDMPAYKYEEENHLASLSLRLSTPQATLEAWLNQCYKVGLLVCEEGYIYSISFLNRMQEIDDKRQLLSEAGRRGGLASSQAQARLKPGSSSKGKESKGKERKVNTPFDFKSILSKYPNKDGSKAAEQKFLNTVKTQEQFEAINRALDNYLKSERVKNGYVKNASTWFNNWQDWVDYEEKPKIVESKHPFSEVK